MKRRARYINWLTRICILILAIWILQKLNILPSFKNIFSSRPVVIDETPILVKEIKSLGQVITATIYDEVVVDSLKGALLKIPGTETQLVLIARGKVLAGINLEQMQASSLTISGDTVRMKLPPTYIMDIISNPDDYEIFKERGNWNPEAVTAVKLRARAKISAHAIEQDIITKATQKAKAVMENFLHTAGFKIVIFEN